MRNVTYVSLPRASWHNLGCFGGTGMYRQPIVNVSLVVHRLLSLAAMRYAWRTLAEHAAPDVVACQNAAIRWADGPVARLRSWCAKCTSARRAEYRSPAPYGCEGVGSSRARYAQLLAGCTRHGLLPAGAPNATNATSRGSATRRRGRAATRRRGLVANQPHK